MRKEHVDLHLKHFKRTQLVISDDYVHALNDPAEPTRLHQLILTNGISYRDDSPMVDGYFSSTRDRFTVRSPESFADAYLRTPTVFELEHYGKVKSLGNWDALPNSSAPSTEMERKDRTSSAVRSSCCTRPTLAITAMRASG